MMLLACLALAIAFSFVLRTPIKKAPWVFWGLAIVLDVVVIMSSQLGLPQWLYSTVVMANGRCLFAFGLFCVVMFTGVLKEGSRARLWLSPIRAELSILAAILVVGHIVRYIGIYSPRLLSAAAASGSDVIASFAVACVVATMLLLLTVTSFKFVRRRMSPTVWKNIQRLAYPFFILIYVHVLLIVGKSALMGRTGAIETLVVMGIVLAAYIVLRLMRYREDKAKAQASPQGVVAEAA